MQTNTGWENHPLGFMFGTKSHPLGFMSGCNIIFRGAFLPSNIVSQFALQKGISKIYKANEKFNVEEHIGPD